MKEHDGYNLLSNDAEKERMLDDRQIDGQTGQTDGRREAHWQMFTPGDTQGRFYECSSYSSSKFSCGLNN